MENFLDESNGVTVLHCSSEDRQCPAASVLHRADRKVWVSGSGLPQELILDLSHMQQRPAEFSCFGWHCWHAYNSNPSCVELFVSLNGQSWVKWANCQGVFRRGYQLFPIDPLTPEYLYLKVVIPRTFGAAKTYLNHLVLYEQLPGQSEETFSNESLNSSYEIQPSAACLSLRTKLQTQLEELRLAPVTPEPPQEPETDEWTETISEMQASLHTLSEKVQRLEAAVEAVDVTASLDTLKADLVQELQARAQPPDLAPQFQQLMKTWERSVLAPQLEQFLEKLDKSMAAAQHTAYTTQLMAKLQAKVNERERKVMQLRSGFNSSASLDF